MKHGLLAVVCALFLCSCNPIKGDWKNVNAPEKRWQITGDTMTHVSHGTMVSKWKYKWVDDENIEIFDIASGQSMRKVHITWNGKRMNLDFNDGMGPTELVPD